MAGLGTIFVELDLSYDEFNKKLQKVKDQASVVTVETEKNFQALGLKSAKHFDYLRAGAENAYQGILHSSTSTANDIVRAEKAKADTLNRINEQQFGKQFSLIETLKKNWLGITAATAGIVIAAERMYDFAKNTASAANDIDRQSKLLGVSTDQFQRWTYAAKMSDVETQSLMTSMKFLSQNIMESKTSGSEADRTFKALGITGGDLQETMYQLADVFARSEDGETKIAIATKLLGKSAMDIIPYLNQGRGGIKALGDEAEKYGGIIGKDLIDAGSRAEDSFKRFETSINNLKFASMPLIEVFAKILEKMGAIIEGGKKLPQAAKSSLWGVLPGGTAVEALMLWAQADQAQVMPNKATEWASESRYIPKTRLPNILEKGEAEKAAKEADKLAETLRQNQIDFTKSMTAAGGEGAQSWLDIGVPGKGYMSVGGQTLKISDYEARIQAEKKANEAIAESYSADYAVPTEKQTVEMKIKSANYSKEMADKKKDAYREMYSDFGKLDDGYYEEQKKLLDDQYKEYDKFVTDKVLLERWHQKMSEKIDDERKLATGNVFDGIRIWMKDNERDTQSWAKASYAIIDSFSKSSKATLSDVMFDGIMGDLKSFEEYWNSIWRSIVRTTTNQISEMVVNAGMNIGGKLLGSAADWLTDWVFASQGVWNIKEKEQPVIAHEGEMVVPKSIAEQIREGGYGGFADMAAGLSGGSTGRGMAELSEFGKSAGRGGLIALGQALAGQGVNPAGWFGGMISGGIVNTALDAMGYNSSTGGWGKALGASAGSILGGPVGAILGALLGGVGGDLLGDWLNARDNEVLLDKYEEIMGSRAQAHLQAGLVANAIASASAISAVMQGGPSIERDLLQSAGFGSDYGSYGATGYGGYTGGDTHGGWGESYLTGTGLEGLPKTGWFYGHKGEIVEKPSDSDAIRKGARGSGDLVIHNYIEMDGKVIGHFEKRVRHWSDDVRVKAERRNRGTRRIYS